MPRKQNSSDEPSSREGFLVGFSWVFSGFGRVKPDAEAESSSDEPSSRSIILGNEDVPQLPPRATLDEIADDAAEDMGIPAPGAGSSDSDNKIHLTLDPQTIAQSAQACPTPACDPKPYMV